MFLYFVYFYVEYRNMLHRVITSSFLCMFYKLKHKMKFILCLKTIRGLWTLISFKTIIVKCSEYWNEKNILQLFMTFDILSTFFVKKMQPFAGYY